MISECPSEALCTGAFFVSSETRGKDIEGGDPGRAFKLCRSQCHIADVESSLSPGHDDN